ncbi:MAG: hypothetical protein VBE63_12845 [Lamprobacter sp.]|uniref:HEAT repeat domain-containing protein n=1 Tax=Lamprobacter sp. TaxID=3100796 RepID=UPI002B256F1E|nr:hypothetical protein [Lamprobacter sp.]MEA3640816.1 hypothetical protein [Lamprobacter sp.]
MSLQRLLVALIVAPLVIGLLGDPVDAAAQQSAVEQAFSAVERGDFGPVSDLAQRGEAIVNAVQPYLSSPQEVLRREALALLSTLGGTRACNALVSALADPSADIRSRAGFALMAHCDLGAIAPTDESLSALLTSLERGNSSAAPLLMLGHFTNTAALDALQSVLQNPFSVKLHPWSPLVSAALPARVALLRLGAAGSQPAIRRVIAQDDLSEQVFLLAVLDQIEDRETLLQLSKHLDDQRPIAGGGGVPSGAVPRRRLCDLALEAFAASLDLTLPFDVSTARRYHPRECHQVAVAVQQRLAQD